MKQSLYLLVVLFCFGSVNYAQNDKPNIIIILADDLGYADVGFNGATDIPTPNIDKIANDGIKFTSGYTSYVVCGPSRAGLMTGRYQQRFGFERNPQYKVNDPNMGLPQTEKTLATVLNPSGYTSGIIGKWHLGAHITNHPLNRGFDFFYGHLGGGHDYFPEDLTIEDSYSVTTESDSYNTWILRNHTPEQTDEYLTDEFSNEAVQFIEDNKDDPFFLFLSYNAPHNPLQASQEYLDRFSHLPDSPRKTYMAMVSAVDDGVGDVLNKLEELSLEENTIVFFLSDNGGPETKNHSDNGVLRGGKSDVYEGGYRVPFAMQWKGTITPGVYNNPVSALDIFATAVEVSNSTVDIERPLDGVNIIPHITGENTEVPHEILFMRKFDQEKFGVRKGAYKLFRNLSNNRTELYNLDDDISETTNIANANLEIVAELEELREAWNIELINPIFEGIVGVDEVPYEIAFQYLWNDDFENYSNGQNLLDFNPTSYSSNTSTWNVIQNDGNGIHNSNKFAQSSSVANVDIYQNHSLTAGKTYTFKVATNIINEATDSKRTHTIRVTSGAHVYAEKTITTPDENTWHETALDFTVIAGKTNIEVAVFREHEGGNVLVDNFSVSKKHNIMLNGDFEHGDLSGWNTWNNDITDEAAAVFEGDWAGYILDNVNGSLQQEIQLKSNTDYQIKATIKSEAVNESVKLIVKYNNSNIINEVINTTTNFTTYTFNFTTGIHTETTRVSIWKNTASFGKQYVDNFEVTEVGNSPTQVRFEEDTFSNIETGIPVQIIYAKIPAPADLGGEIWSITNGTGTATVDQSGRITPLTPGIATVKVSFEYYPDIFAEYQFTINSRVPQTLYVDALYGDDSNSGISAATPWQSFDKINNTNLIPGDVILLKSGQEFFGKLIPSASGEENNPITFGSYFGSERAAINGRNFKMCIDASGKEYLVFENLILKNDAFDDDATLETGADEKRYGFYAHVGYSGVKNNISLTNIKAHKIYPTNTSGTENSNSYLGYGFYFTADGTGNTNYYQGISITNCEITDIGNVGISINKWIPNANPPDNLYQQDITIRNNNLHHIGGSGMVFFNVQDFLIEQNLVTYTGDYSLDNRQHGRGSGFWSVRCKDGILQHNEFSHVRGPADSCGAHIDIENDNIIVQYNLSIDNAGGFAEFMGANTNCIYRYNISINDGFRVKWTTGATVGSNPEMYSPNGSKNTQQGKIIWFSDFTGFNGQEKIGAKYNQVYNNTIYIGETPEGDPITSLIRFENDTDYNEVKNNIFYIDAGSTLNYTKAGTVGDNNTFDYNMYSDGGPSNNFFKGTSDLTTTNPLFINTGGATDNDYKIAENSPAINAGSTIADNGDIDYWNTFLADNLATDIGAHEFIIASLGLDDSHLISNRLYPNPATDQITINGLSYNTSYKIYNSVGQLSKSGQTENSINISELKTGIYIIQIENRKSIKFVKK